MRLRRARVQNYRSVNDTDWFQVEPRKTILVGPNEAGKTAVLRALYQVKMPPDESPTVEPLRDFPRRRYTEISSGELDPSDAIVAQAEFELDAKERALITAEAPHLGDVTLVQLILYHDNESRWLFPEVRHAGRFGDAEKPLATLRGHLDKTEGGPDLLVELDALVAGWSENRELRLQDGKKLDDWLTKAGAVLDFDVPAVDKAFDSVRAVARRYSATRAAYTELQSEIPFFVYFSNIFRVRPRIHLASLALREEQGDLDDEYDFGNLCLLRLLGFTARELSDFANEPPPMPRKQGGQTVHPTADELKEYQDRLDERQLRLNAAAVRLTEMVREVWGDEAMTLDFRVDGQYLKVVVRDDLGVEVELDQRSEGFQWLVSFFVVFTAQAKGDFANAILLLDEPGMSLHGLKQKQFQLTVSKLAERNQTLFTTHSPFMIGTNELDMVRIVEMPSREIGTKVHTDFAVHDERSLFPLQAHLGYDLGQTLFGQHRNLVVEGITDYWYLQSANLAALDADVEALDDKVSILPAGDAGKVVYHATVLHAQGLKMAALFDSDSAGEQAASQESFVSLVKSSQILRVGDFYDGPVDKPETEDLLRETLLAVAREDLGIDATGLAAANPARPTCDLLSQAAKTAGATFSKYRLAKAFVRWGRDHAWGDFTDAERDALLKLFKAANKGTK